MNLMEKRLRKLCAEGIPLNDLTAVRKAYGQQYNVGILSRDIARYAAKIMNDTPTSVESESEVEDVVEEEEETVTTFYPKDTDPTRTPNQFVPDALMAAGNPIKQAVVNSGGRETAIAVGKVIESVGGLANFIRAVEFLETVNALPTKPQLSEEPKFRDIERENGEALERVRNNLLAK